MIDSKTFSRIGEMSRTLSINHCIFHTYFYNIMFHSMREGGITCYVIINNHLWRELSVAIHCYQYSSFNFLLWVISLLRMWPIRFCVYHSKFEGLHYNGCNLALPCPIFQIPMPAGSSLQGFTMSSLKLTH